jgi:hypothetical protein
MPERRYHDPKINENGTPILDNNKKTEFATTGVLVCAGPMIHSTWLIILLDQNLHEITT